MDFGTDIDGFVHRWWPALVRLAVLLGASRTEAEDLAQTALMRCVSSWSRVERARDQDAYVYRVLVNCFKKSRARRWWAEVPSSVDEFTSALTPSQDVLEDVVVREMLIEALSHVPANQRTMLVLRYYADLSEQQVADTLGIALGTVKSRTARALVRLQTELENRRFSPDLKEMRRS